MRRTRSSPKQKSPSWRAPFEIKRVKLSMNIAYEGSTPISNLDGDPHHLFSRCLNRMRPHLWFKIASVENNNHDNISYATGIPFLLLRKVLLYLNYIFIVNNYVKINGLKWKELCSMKLADMEMNVRTYCPRGEITQYYLCCGISTYYNPDKQLFAGKITLCLIYI